MKQITDGCRTVMILFLWTRNARFAAFVAFLVAAAAESTKVQFHHHIFPGTPNNVRFSACRFAAGLRSFAGDLVAVAAAEDADADADDEALCFLATRLDAGFFFSGVGDFVANFLSVAGDFAADFARALAARFGVSEFFAAFFFFASLLLALAEDALLFAEAVELERFFVSDALLLAGLAACSSRHVK